MSEALVQALVIYASAGCWWYAHWEPAYQRAVRPSPRRALAFLALVLLAWPVCLWWLWRGRRRA